MTRTGTTYYYILCECGKEASELTANGEVLIFTSKHAASREAAHMRVLMEGGPRVTYTVKAAR